MFNYHPLKIIEINLSESKLAKNVYSKTFWKNYDDKTVQTK